MLRAGGQEGGRSHGDVVGGVNEEERQHPIPRAEAVAVDLGGRCTEGAGGRVRGRAERADKV